MSVERSYTEKTEMIIDKTITETLTQLQFSYKFDTIISLIHENLLRTCMTTLYISCTCSITSGILLKFRS